MMDELQSASPSPKKRKSVVTDLLQGRGCLAKKARIVGDLAESPATPSQSPSKSSFKDSPVASLSPTTRFPSGKKTKAGPSTNLNAASQSRDVIPPVRVSSRVSRPTFKKRASAFERRSRSLISDGTPPASILPPAPTPSLKRKKPTSTPVKRLGGNSTPSKSKWVDPNPIELTSSEDGRRAQPPQKRVKHTHKKPLSSRVIDLCSTESEDVASSPRRTRTRDERSVVVVLSTDEESDPEIPPFNSLAFRETDPRKRPPSPSLRDTSLPIEVKTVFRTSSSPQASTTPVPTQDVLVVEDGVTEENNIHVENSIHVEKEVDLSRGSLQVLYDEALARCAQELQHAKDIADEPSSFSSLGCLPPSRIIHYSTQTQSPTLLHTPLFFGRIIYRLRARLKQLKTVKAFSDAKSEAFPADINFNCVEASKLKEEQDIQTYSDTVMESSTVDSGPSEFATKTTLVPLLDFQDDALSDTHAAHSSPNVLVNNSDVNEIPMSKAESPPSANQESPLSPELIIFQDISIPDSNQTQKVPTDHSTATPDRTNSSAISPNMFYDTPNQSNLDAINHHIETPQDTSLSRRENGTHRVPVIKPSILKDAIFLVQTLQERKRYEASNISGFPLLPASKSNDTTKIPAASESLSESTKHAMIRSTFSVAVQVSNSEDTISKLSESSMILPDHAMMRDVSPQSTEDTLLTLESPEMPTMLTEQTATLNLSLPAGPSNEDISPDSECISESLAIPDNSLFTGSSRADTLSPYNSSPSTHSRQSPDSSISVKSVDRRLITSDDSPYPLTPPIKVQKQEPFLCSSSLIDVSFFDIDISELNLQTLMGGNKFDDDDDDISISGMELVYPEEII